MAIPKLKLQPYLHKNGKYRIKGEIWHSVFYEMEQEGFDTLAECIHAIHDHGYELEKTYNILNKHYDIQRVLQTAD